MFYITFLIIFCKMSWKYPKVFCNINLKNKLYQIVWKQFKKKLRTFKIKNSSSKVHSFRILVYESQLFFRLFNTVKNLLRHNITSIHYLHNMSLTVYCIDLFFCHKTFVYAKWLCRHIDLQNSIFPKDT